ncbi:MAG: methylenetetrahydrofolate--tRNA-(uracil(54)-C(5))-methyltransferase (FADH(2)-oxidizing) TrmFO [Myxococcales bacterium]|nr:methylenetetrahydrofolate--tRNA-(uracil(54)-C(5))-methyltransferase (FADH(2)-oxidizing) TrmFO [Myxococcales bacterium]
MSQTPEVTVVGAGLAGCEVALQLARRGVKVRLIEQKPLRRTPAQTSDAICELVCSNSFRSANVQNAIGLLKWEMRHVGSAVLQAADANAVPAGDALAVDRDLFSAEMERLCAAEPSLERVSAVVESVPEGLCVIATGPLTGSELAADLALRTGRDSMYFYDSIAPIIDAESINWDIVWRQSRWDKGESADYANVPLSKDEYHAFVTALASGEKVPPRAFEEPKYFEGCLPIEVMVDRGPMTLAFGPLKPVGLTDPRTGRRSFAVVQLRMENCEGTAWNMVGFQTRLKYPEQKRIFTSLPGLEKAEFLRFGSVHRNTYLHAPSLLTDDLHLVDSPDLFFAGQITGVEGYVESTACGLLVAWQVLARLRGVELPVLPKTTALGSMKRHLRGEGLLSAYAPSNLNFSLFEPLPEAGKRLSKGDRRAAMAERAQTDLAAYWSEAEVRLR